MQQPAGPARARSTRGLVVALSVLLIPLFLAIGLYRLLGREAPPMFDARPAYQAARAASAFPVASPKRLPAGWRVVSADYQADGDPGPTLRVALHVPGGAVQLIESAAPARSLVPLALGKDAYRENPVDIVGRTWLRYATERGHRALVLIEPDRTIIVVGTADEPELRRLAAMLH